MRCPVSIHRAGVLAVLLPGWGDWHAGRRGRGTLLALACMACLSWLAVVGGVLLLDQLLVMPLPEPPSPRQWTVDPLLQLAAAFLGLVWIWHLGIATAILAARERCREEDGASTPGVQAPQVPQAPWFAVLVSWCAPGTGQIYAGRVRFGLGLLAAYLLGYLTIIPVLQHTLASAAGAASALGAWHGDPPLVLASKIQHLVMALRLEAVFSLPWKLHELLRAFAMADACALLAVPGLSRSAQSGWESASLARLFGHLLLGWLCPGAGQFLQGRERAGWRFFGMFWGLQLAGAILFAADAISLERLSLLQDVGTALAAAAGVEACWRMEDGINPPPSS
ncbi:DUF6677 family protein [Megalodesulfovibrio gigas]|uniref:Putative Signal peptidase I n=1 Tax=Megalodesulfovibrio gigas (strain ATCC 19364 / DSM 1382 / NCIMB 9332 / VKM B-1759) TaxID=1121448 RepID=T2G8G2_MEGG1|nr:DUF6677 family protein [Megalodesulfovibrio gigas]AGW12474.1 putative Signal peptidase I [Megalodesulfovibrio gigas DSM 1382 = ATCC 19364]